MQAEVSFVEDRSALEGKIPVAGQGLTGSRPEKSCAVVIRHFDQLAQGVGGQVGLRQRWGEQLECQELQTGRRMLQGCCDAKPGRLGK